VQALARAASVAASKGNADRARGFFELALSGGGAQEETLAALEDAAREASAANGNKQMIEILASSFSQGGHGSRDGGRTRSALLRRAADLAHRDLADTERAFGWLADSLVAHVDVASLDAVNALGEEVGDMTRVDGVLTRALGEVFDGPLVRQLLARRAQLRKERLDDKTGAATDLKKLHDLAPTDQAVMEELTQLLTELGDYRGMVQVLEDQILRGKDPALRADLARRVAVLWEERLADTREAADAWRRVLRMKSGDPEAQAGLERAKTNSLRKPADGIVAAPLPKTSEPPPARSASVRPPPSFRSSSSSSLPRASAVPGPRGSGSPSSLPSVPPAPTSGSITPVSSRPAEVASEIAATSTPVPPPMAPAADEAEPSVVPSTPAAPITAPAILPDLSEAGSAMGPGYQEGAAMPATVPPPPMVDDSLRAQPPAFPSSGDDGRPTTPPPPMVVPPAYPPLGTPISATSFTSEETVSVATSPAMLEAIRGDREHRPFTNEEQTPVHAALPSQPAPSATSRPSAPWDLPRLHDNAGTEDATKVNTGFDAFAAGTEDDEEEIIEDLDDDIEAVDDEELIEAFDDESSPG
jgi:cellulose synthase operon protein C